MNFSFWNFYFAEKMEEKEPQSIYSIPRVPQCMSPLLQASVSPHGPRGWDTLACGWGGGGSQLGRLKNKPVYSVIWTIHLHVGNLPSNAVLIWPPLPPLPPPPRSCMDRCTECISMRLSCKHSRVLPWTAADTGSSALTSLIEVYRIHS